MGKQSGRLYFDGEDHLDMVFNDGTYPYNYAKMYRGEKLLWQREKPKFMFLYNSLNPAGSALGTTDRLMTISGFIRSPANSKYDYDGNLYGSFYDIEYAFDKYFSIFLEAKRINNGSRYENTYFICYSENGYDWKKIKEISFDEENRPKALKRYFYKDNEVIVIVCRKKIYFLNESFKLGEVYDGVKEYQSLNGGREERRIQTVSKKGALIIKIYGINELYVLNEENVSEIITDDYALSYSVNTDEDGYFYKTKYKDASKYDIYKSSNGVSWELFYSVDFSKTEYFDRINIKLFCVIKNYLYILGELEQENRIENTEWTSAYIKRINLITKKEEEKIFEDVNYLRYFAVDHVVFLRKDTEKDFYYEKLKDDFSFEEDLTRVTCKFDSKIVFNQVINITSSDKESIICV